jgi:hypothetical protein
MDQELLLLILNILVFGLLGGVITLIILDTLWAIHIRNHIRRWKVWNELGELEE